MPPKNPTREYAGPNASKLSDSPKEDKEKQRGRARAVRWSAWLGPEVHLALQGGVFCIREPDDLVQGDRRLPPLERVVVHDKEGA